MLSTPTSHHAPSPCMYRRVEPVLEHLWWWKFTLLEATSVPFPVLAILIFVIYSFFGTNCEPSSLLRALQTSHLILFTALEVYYSHFAIQKTRRDSLFAQDPRAHEWQGQQVTSQLSGSNSLFSLPGSSFLFFWTHRPLTLSIVSTLWGYFCLLGAERESHTFLPHEHSSAISRYLSDILSTPG